MQRGSSNRKRKNHLPDRTRHTSAAAANATECIVTVSIHSAYETQPEELKQQEFELKGSHTLADLRNAIYCVNGMGDNSTTDVHEVSSSTESSVDCSHLSLTDSFFFIEGVLYMDMQCTDAVDYLSTHGTLKGYPLLPLEWLQTVKAGGIPQKRGRGSSTTHQRSRRQGRGSSATPTPTFRHRYFPPVELPTSDSSQSSGPNSMLNTLLADFLATQHDIDIQPMESIQVKSLNFRANVRYLYCHMHQRCEHYMYFSDVRIFHPLVDVFSYPRLTFMAKFERRKCEVCCLWSTQYITYGDRLAVNNPTHYCQHCYHMLHYATDGKLLYDDFVVFPYLHHMR